MWSLVNCRYYLFHTSELPVATDRNHAFNIYYSLFECKAPPNYVKDEILTPPLVNVSSDEQMKIFTSAKFLIPILAENPKKSEYYHKFTPKGVRKIYVTYSTNAEINADDNGAYTKTRNMTKLYTIATGQVFIDHRDYDKRDELIAVIELQRVNKDFIRSVSCLRNSVKFISDYVQLNDVAFFCVDKNGVLSIYTTFNLCFNWVTDTCYKIFNYRHKMESIRSSWGQFLFILKKMLSSLIGLQAKCVVSSQDKESEDNWNRSTNCSI